MFGLAPLHVAIIYNQHDVVEYLIENEANIQYGMAFYSTP
jgi:ankyrin repeat protein